MIIVINDAETGKVYTKYQLGNLHITNPDDIKLVDDCVTIFVHKDGQFPTQEQFNMAGMR